MKKQLKLFITLSLFFSNLVISHPDISKKEIRWDWNQIDSKNSPLKPEQFNFPKNFIWGVATSAHQVEGNCNCQWSKFEADKKLEPSGMACDNWNLYKEDVKLLNELQVDAYRFSINWSKWQPTKNGPSNKEVIAHYHSLINELIQNNKMPVITLHHFDHPQWFEDLNAFEKEENIIHFVNFCKEVFNEFSDKVSMWCTINEPGVYAFQGYVRGEFPPAKLDLQMAGIVNKNLIIAHIETYKALKSMRNGNKCQIGITHSITQYHAYHEPSKYNPLTKLEYFLEYYLNHVFYDAVMQFFITGNFEFKAPKILQLLLAGKFPNSAISLQYSLLPIKLNYAFVNYSYVNPVTKKYNSKEILDFFGIQPYSTVLINWKNKDAATAPSLRPEDEQYGNIATDMPYRICPESLYRAINQASFVGVPIYITENGIADSKDDRREIFIKRYLYALQKALQDGYDVRGYFYWSLYDNFEWSFGYKMKFGLYKVNFATQERSLRKGAEFYRDVIKHNKHTH